LFSRNLGNWAHRTHAVGNDGPQPTAILALLCHPRRLDACLCACPSSLTAFVHRASPFSLFFGCFFGFSSPTSTSSERAPNIPRRLLLVREGAEACGFHAIAGDAPAKRFVGYITESDPGVRGSLLRSGISSRRSMRCAAGKLVIVNAQNKKQTRSGGAVGATSRRRPLYFAAAGSGARLAKSFRATSQTA